MIIDGSGRIGVEKAGIYYSMLRLFAVCSRIL
jgi:hypothetical protein